MIDKITLYTKNYKLTNNNKLNEYYYSSGTENIKKIKNRSYWYNTEEDDINLYINIRKDILYLNFSASKFYNYINYPLISNHETLFFILNEIESSCNKIGLEFELDKLKIGKIEIAKDIQTNFPYSSYSSVFNGLDGKRLFGNQHQDTYYFGNKSRAFCFYNKTEELKEKFNYKIDKNILRAELKLNNASVVRRDAQLFSVEDLLSPNILEWCNSIYKNLLKTLVFHYDHTTENKEFETNLEVFQSYVSDFGSKAFKKYLFDLAIKQFITDGGNFQALFDIAKQEGVLPSTITYQKKKILKLSKNSRFKDFKSVTSLYRELKKKLLEY